MSFVAYTDGGCSGNPGPGGWGAILLAPNGKATELWGSDPATTNNRMELTAPLEVLRLLPVSVKLEIRSDSQYVVNTVTQWMAGWKKLGWRKKDGGEVSNLDLVQELDALLVGRQVAWKWVRGHNGDPGNEYADKLTHRSRKHGNGMKVLPQHPFAVKV